MHNSAQLRCFENGNDDFGVDAFWIGDAARVGYFVPLNGPLNGHPPSISYVLHLCNIVFTIITHVFAINDITVRTNTNCFTLQYFFSMTQTTCVHKVNRGVVMTPMNMCLTTKTPFQRALLLGRLNGSRVITLSTRTF